VTSNPGNRPVAGAQIASGGAVVAVTGADGGFSLPNPGALAVTISAQGYLTRQTRISGDHTDLVIDLISRAAPFELEFYRQLTRDTQGGGPALPLARWTVDPVVYVFTNQVTDRGDPTDDPIPAELVELCRDVVPGIVRQVSGGRLSVARLESGTDRDIEAGRTGYLVIEFRERHRFSDPDQGVVTDCVDAASPVRENRASASLCYNNQQAQCPLISPGVVAHEVGHTLGLFHACYPAAATGAPYTMCRGSASAAGRACQATFDPKELFHSAILYSRPPGNVDEDQDPPDFSF
jgi:hypothetical protein